MSTYSNAVLADSPLLFYQLDDSTTTLVDTGSLGIDGYYSVNSYWLQQAPPVAPGYQVPPSNSVKFNPDGTTGGLAWSNPLPSFATTAVTFEVWFTPDYDQPSSLRGLVTHTSSPYTSLYISSNGNLTFEVRGSAFDSGVYVLDSAPHYAAATWESAGGVYVIYLDGNEVARGVTSVGLSIPAGGSLGIGVYHAVTSDTFSGRIDNVAVYGTALTATQIKSHSTSIVSPRGNFTLPQVMHKATHLKSTRNSTANDHQDTVLFPVGIGVLAPPVNPVVAIQSVTVNSSTSLRITFTIPTNRQPALEASGNYVISPPLDVLSVVAENIASPTYVDLTVSEMLDAEPYTITIYNALEAA